MDSDELATYLQALDRDSNYRVDRVLKSAPQETTEIVYFVGNNAAELGPFIRKRLRKIRGIGSGYEEIYRAQKKGARFRYLPRIYECYDNGEELVLIIEYVQGETLRDFAYRHDPSPKLALNIFPRLCDAVTELHEDLPQPIIHRDLKPTNIILTDTSLTLIDFGIARAYHDDAETDTTIFGTRAYAPPEQFGFGQTDVRSDVYALGMILYYLLVEEVPSPRLAGSDFSDPRIPPNLRPVLAKATAFDPRNRYPAVRDLRRAFLAAFDEPEATAEEKPLSREGKRPIAQPGFTGQSFASQENDDFADRSFASQENDGFAGRNTVSRESVGFSFTAQPGFHGQDIREGKSINPNGTVSKPFNPKAAEKISRSSSKTPDTRTKEQEIPKASTITGVSNFFGILWNIVLVALWLLLLAASISITFWPSGEMANHSFAYRFLSYFGFIMVCYSGICIAFYDKRRLRRKFPCLANLTFKRGIAIGGIAFAVGVVCIIACILLERFGAV